MPATDLERLELTAAKFADLEDMLREAVAQGARGVVIVLNASRRKKLRGRIVDLCRKHRLRISRCDGEGRCYTIAGGGIINVIVHECELLGMRPQAYCYA